jgi:hypothetical protein
MNAGRDQAEVLAEVADMLGALGAMTRLEERLDDIIANLDALEETLELSNLTETDRAWVKKHVEWARRKACAQAGLGVDDGPAEARG